MSAIGKRQHLALTERTTRNAEAKAEASSGLHHAVPKEERCTAALLCWARTGVQRTAESGAAILMESCLARQPDHHSDSTAPRELESIVH